MTKSKKQELTVFLIIVGIASFFRLYMLVPIVATGTIISPLIGILTVVGLYLLARELFEWRLAAIASYLAAISFWHVDISRTGSAATIIPLALVYAFYFLWKGLKNSHLPNFVIAGIFGGIACLPGSLISTSYIFLGPLIAIVLFVNYWWYLKKDFDHAKYEHAKTKLLQGFVLLALTAFVVALLVGLRFWTTVDIFSGASAGVSFSNIIKTLGMFNFTSNPLFPWPIGIFFVVGFINELIHWLKRKHGHFSTVHTLLFAWFFVMLIPGFLSPTAPDALLTIGVLPVVMIFIARGIWWFFDKLSSWYKMNDTHSIHEAHAVTALVVIVFLFSIGFMEYWRYFN